MKKTGMLRYILLSMFLVNMVPLKAQEGNQSINITTTAVPFLRISPDARAGGMGDVAIAVSPDVNSVFYNQAKIPFASQQSAIGVNYTPWLKEIADDMFLGTIAGFHKLDDQQALAASIRYFNIGSISLMDYNGNKLQTARPREFAIDLGYSRKLSDQFGIGATLRYIHSNLASGTMNGSTYKAGRAVAGDLSFYYNGLNEKEKGWTAGLTLSNLGSRIGYTEDTKDFLPASIAVGAAYTESWDETNAITFALDVNKLLVPKIPVNPDEMPAYRKTGVVESWFKSADNGAWQFGFGGEYVYNKQLFLRLGYNSKSYTQGSWQYVTAGIGVKFSSAAVNFSYLVPTGDKSTRNPLGNTVRFGVQFGWEK